MAGRKRTVVGVALLAAGGLAPAAEPPPQPAPGAAPSAELLLFLAEFKDARGQPIDPMQLPQQPARSEPDVPAAAPASKPPPSPKASATPDAKPQPPRA